MRAIDVDTYERNGVPMVSANGKGISLFTEEALQRLKGGWLWKIPHGTNLPVGLGLNNDRGAHYMICPTTDMTVDGYKALLSDLALKCERVRKA